MSDTTNRRERAKRWQELHGIDAKPLPDEKVAELLKLMPPYSEDYSIEWRQALSWAQGDICAICDKLMPRQLDHSRETGRVRGLLCGFCNQGLNQFADSPKRLRRAAEYLEKRTIRSRTPNDELDL